MLTHFDYYHFNAKNRNEISGLEQKYISHFNAEYHISQSWKDLYIYECTPVAKEH